ncbi:MAG TPA: hypothetical protein VHK63_01290 [Candidatus Limnocylindria bacterium]|nr:hypothetical protein [Candidatus Limnocylindria bacterium]
MVTKKVTKPVTRSRARDVVPARPARTRAHSLAPAHLGEAASAAVLAVSVLGLAIFIVGVAMAVSGLTLGSRFGSEPPPNVGELGVGQVVGGLGLAVLGLVLSGSSLAVLAEVPRSRPLAAAVSALAAVLAVAGAVLVQLRPGNEVVLTAALAVAAVILAAAAFVLVRPRR